MGKISSLRVRPASAGFRLAGGGATNGSITVVSRADLFICSSCFTIPVPKRKTFPIKVPNLPPLLMLLTSPITFRVPNSLSLYISPTPSFSLSK